MQSRNFRMCPRAWLGCLMVLVGLGALAVAPARAAEPQPFHVKAMYVEGCTCRAPCPCQLTGAMPSSCLGVNAIAFTGGSYQGIDLAGAKVAFATEAGKWVRLYVDAAKPNQRGAVVAILQAYAQSFGKIEEIKDAAIRIAGKDGRYTLKVDDGQVMSLVTEPVLGGDGKTPLAYSNIHDPLHPTVMQGQTVSGSYRDGDRTFELSDSNAYFNPQFESKGSL